MRSRFHVGLALVMALLGFLVASAFLQERLRERAEPAQREELRALIEGRRSTIRDLSEEVASLSGRLARAQAEAARGSEEVRAVVRRVEQLEGVAGLSGLQGPGVVVELSDSDERPRTPEEESDLRIQDLDLQLVVNALWEAGAEAVAVNGRRVVATTAIRKAGQVILVNYRSVASPYRVVALGDPDSLARYLLASEIAQRFDVWRDVYGLGFSVAREDRLFVPPLGGRPELRWATPEEGAG